MLRNGDMLPVEAESNGIKITILNYTLNKKCKKDCWSSDVYWYI